MKHLERRVELLNALYDRRRALERELLSLGLTVPWDKVHNLKRTLAYVSARIGRLERRLK